MTQTYNEREALLEDARKAFNFMDVGDALNPDGILMACIEKFAQLQKFRAQSPTSQNEQQEAVYILTKKISDVKKFGSVYAHLHSCLGQQIRSANEYTVLFTSPPKQAIPEGWISVNDKLPEDGVYVIAANIVNGELWNWNKARYSSTAKRWFIGNNYAFDHSHWMPLLAPTNTEVGE